MNSDFFSICFDDNHQIVFTNNIDFSTPHMSHHLYDDVADLQYDIKQHDIVIHFLTNGQPFPLKLFKNAHILLIENDTIEYYEDGHILSTAPYSPEKLNDLIRIFARDYKKVKELERMVYIDELTKLTNRKALLELLDHYIAGDMDFALLLVDCDNFKIINDGNGHLVGDDYLKQIASRLQVSQGISCRLGGDEFVIVLPSVTQKVAKSIATEIKNNVNQPMTCQGVNFPHVGCSIGVTMSSNVSASELLQQADVAMYVVKQLGGNNVQMFNDELCQKHYRRMQVIKHISQAHDNKEYSLNIQPIYSCETHEPVGGEMLLRWTDPKHETDISPAEFIPLLEQTGEIVRIGKWIISESIKNLSHLRQYGIVDDDFWLSINLSAKQLTHDTVAHIKQQLEFYQISSANIHLELTESTLVDSNGYANEVIGELRDMGHKIYLDDFGTGYCSLAYIKRLNIDGIKIDRAFITNVQSDTIEHVIINAIIDIAHFLNISIIAEGIEQQETEQYCCSLGCTHLQGMYLSEPLSIDQFIVSADP